MNKQYRIIALPGEGIGSEIVAATLTILQRIAQQQDFKLQIEYGAIGRSALKEYGSYFPEVTAQLCKGADGILFGRNFISF
jgi:3-isopropylmalate dehydrogenase/3-benzylmalate dehydrogenase